MTDQASPAPAPDPEQQDRDRMNAVHSRLDELVANALGGLRGQLEQFDREHLPGLLDKFKRLASEESTGAVGRFVADAQAAIDDHGQKVASLIADGIEKTKVTVAELEGRIKSTVDGAASVVEGLEARAEHVRAGLGEATAALVALEQQIRTVVDKASADVATLETRTTAAGTALEARITAALAAAPPAPPSPGAPTPGP